MTHTPSGLSSTLDTILSVDELKSVSSITILDSSINTGLLPRYDLPFSGIIDTNYLTSRNSRNGFEFEVINFDNSIEPMDSSCLNIMYTTSIVSAPTWDPSYMPGLDSLRLGINDL